MFLEAIQLSFVRSLQKNMTETIIDFAVFRWDKSLFKKGT